MAFTRRQRAGRSEVIRFLADECLNPKPVAALRDCVPPVDIATVTDVGLRTAADPMILTWAAEA